jgi:hypothetical protein
MMRTTSDPPGVMPAVGGSAMIGGWVGVGAGAGVEVEGAPGPGPDGSGAPGPRTGCVAPGGAVSAEGGAVALGGAGAAVGPGCGAGCARAPAPSAANAMQSAPIRRARKCLRARGNPRSMDLLGTRDQAIFASRTTDDASNVL